MGGRANPLQDAAAIVRFEGRTVATSAECGPTTVVVLRAA